MIDRRASKISHAHIISIKISLHIVNMQRKLHATCIFCVTICDSHLDILISCAIVEIQQK